MPSQQQGQQDKVKWCCKHCQRVLSGKNDNRMKKHLLNPRACKLLDSSAAADCTAKEIAQPACGKTDRTVHRTVSYRIYGANFQNTVKTVLTIPYRITVHRTVHRTATALMMSHNTSLLPYSPPAGTGACPSAGASPGHLQKSCHWGGQKR